MSALYAFRVVRRLMICLIVSLIFLSGAVAADLPDIWFTPLHPHDDKGSGRAGAEDYMNLFVPDAPWQTVQKHVSVFEIYSDFARRASDADIKKLAEGLAARNIALAVEAPVLTQTAWCEPGAPIRTDTVAPLMARLKGLGAKVRYLAASGPLVDGHTYTKEYYCHRSIPEVAADVARAVAAVRQIFPDIEVGDIEPVGRHDQYPDWKELDAWVSAWKLAMGAPPAFLHLDINWGLPWSDDLGFIAEHAHANGVPLGIIFNGDAYDLSDADYSRDVSLHVQQITELKDARVNDAVFQSWQIYPRHVLPEADPNSMTGAILSYLRPATTLQKVGGTSSGRIRVRLTDAAGAPVANAKIIEQTFEAGSGAKLFPQSITGAVPSGAVAAAFALRVQTECTCPSRPTKLIIADFQYSEPDRPIFYGNVGSWVSVPTRVMRAIAVNGQRGLEVDAAPNQALNLTGQRFPVTAGLTFDARFNWRVDPHSEGAGFAALIFFDENGNEMHRDLHDMLSTWHYAGQTLTNTEGIGEILHRPSTVYGESFRLSYAGDRIHRPARVLDIESQ